MAPPTDMALPYVVARAVNILLNESLVNIGFHEEDVISSGKPVHQYRLDFEMIDKWRGGAASVRWFTVGEFREYQYRNKVRKGRIVNAGYVPGFVDICTRELTKTGTPPGSLALTEASLDPEFAGRKFVRMEQSYVVGEKRSDQSFILRVELSWDHNPADGIQPPDPWASPPPPRYSESGNLMPQPASPGTIVDPMQRPPFPIGGPMGGKG